MDMDAAIDFMLMGAFSDSMVSIMDGRGGWGVLDVPYVRLTNGGVKEGFGFKEPLIAATPLLAWSQYLAELHTFVSGRGSEIIWGDRPVCSHDTWRDKSGWVVKSTLIAN